MVDIEDCFRRIGDVPAALTFFYLVHKADDEGCVRASYTDMARELNRSRSTLHKYVKLMADKGLVEQRANKERTKNTLIYILQAADYKQVETESKKGVRTKDEQRANKIKQTLAERKAAFTESLKPYLAKYGRDMLNDFYRYWSQVNEGGTKMLWEKQKAFEIGKRLATWKKNDDERRRPQRTADIGMVIQKGEDKFKNEEVW